MLVYLSILILLISKGDCSSSTGCKLGEFRLHPTECSAYFECSQINRWIKRLCPRNLQFDMDSRVCIHTVAGERGDCGEESGCNRTTYKLTFPCPPGWVELRKGGACLTSPDDGKKLDWDRARQACQELGADLPRLDNRAIDREMQVYLKSSMWIGLREIVEHKRVRLSWLDDKNKATYLNGVSSEMRRRSKAGSNCFEKAKASNGQWRRQDCRWRLPVVCQMRSGHNPSSPDLEISYDKPPSSMYRGSLLVAKCGAFVGDEGHIKFMVLAENKSALRDMGTYLNDVKLLIDRDYVMDGPLRCGRYSSATLTLKVDKQLEGKRVQCCRAVIHGFPGCRDSLPIRTIQSPQPPILSIEADESPVTILYGSQLFATCFSSVGASGAQTWQLTTIFNSNYTDYFWKVDMAGRVTRPNASIDGVDVPTKEVDITREYKQIQSKLIIKGDRTFRGATISCYSYDALEEWQVFLHRTELVETTPPIKVLPTLKGLSISYEESKFDANVTLMAASAVAVGGVLGMLLAIGVGERRRRENEKRWMERYASGYTDPNTQLQPDTSPSPTWEKKAKASVNDSPSIESSMSASQKSLDELTIALSDEAFIELEESAAEIPNKSESTTAMEDPSVPGISFFPLFTSILGRPTTAQNTTTETAQSTSTEPAQNTTSETAQNATETDPNSAAAIDQNALTIPPDATETKSKEQLGEK